jgi:glucokinase
MLLAGDIGGTKTVLALVSKEKGPHHPVLEARFESDEYESLADIVIEFLSSTDQRPKSAFFGVAGPVHNERVRVTNLPWEVDVRKLTQILDGVSVSLLNDLEAIASAVPELEPEDLVTLKSGKAIPEGPIAVIAPGTGLGEAFLFWDCDRYRPIASEGGHTDFAPATALEVELLTYLLPRLNHVSYERVCSGMGIPTLYGFFKESGRYSEPEWLKKELQTTDDATPIIVKSAQQQSAEICEATLDLFLAILGSEAGNLVLQVLATGGVYLAGGIPPRILPQLRSHAFLEAFTRKGRFSDLLWQVPVYVIINPKAALYGAASQGLLAADWC